LIGKRVTRRNLGLPEDWGRIEGWCRKPFQFGLPLERRERKPTEFDSVDFSADPDPGFWKRFPKHDLPTAPTTRVNVGALENMIKERRSAMTTHEVKKADSSLNIMQQGAPAYQLTDLPGAKMKNAPSIKKCGPEFTETLKKWVQEGHVAGPFNEPPVPNLRLNSLMAEEQKDKIRPVLNMSNPKGKSFNDNIDTLSVGRATMSSAKQFGKALLRSGRGSLMSKMDMKDAYKLIPARPEDYRLQGFFWHGSIFIETQQIFGASTSVNNFDTVAKTLQLLARLESKIPKYLVQQTLDDTACVGPPDSGWCEEFTHNYKKICNQVNINLAADCPKNEKAFSNATIGTVLGIRFNSRDLTWRMPSNKVGDILTDIHTFITGGHVDLKQTQKLAGRLNHLSQMCPFLKGFRRPLNKLLGSFEEDERILKPVTQELIEDLRVWAAATCDAGGWLPIASEPQVPPLFAMYFTSDAAGGTGTHEWAGVASLGHTEDGDIRFMCRGQWPPNIKTDLDEKGAAFKSKMTTLELVGLFLPFLTMPETLRGRHVVLRVDNKSVVHAWQNKSSKGDATASALVRALMVVTAYLECHVYVEHTKRNSTTESYLADCLTRDTTAGEAWPSIQGARILDPPQDLWDWLQEPTVDWQLGFKLVDNLKEKM